MRDFQSILVAVLFLLLGGCALNPATKRPEPVLISTAMEERLGVEQHKLIEREMGLESDPKLIAYVRQIGQRLAVHSPRQDLTYRFYVADMPEPNAFATMGGYVYVTRGLLAFTNSEDELAGVVGHEIAHVAARHINQQVVRRAPFAIVFGIPAAITGSIVRPVGDIIGGVGQFTSGIFLAPYSRSQEAGADKLGQQLAAKAGYDPAALSSFMTTLGRLVELQGGDPTRTPFFATHPSPAGRAERTRKRAATLARAPYDPVAPDQTGFLHKLDGLLVGLSGAEGAFVKNRFLHAILDFSLRFPEDWHTHNTPQVVAATSEGDEALLALSIVAKGDDPVMAGHVAAREARIRLAEPPVRLQINGLPAARARGQAGGGSTGVTLDLTWIAHGGNIFQIVGASKPPEFAAFQPTFETTAMSFRRLGADRDKVTESRLRLVKARGREKLPALVERRRGTWSPEESAVANGWEVEKPLSSGQLVKVPIAERFRPPQ